MTSYIMYVNPTYHSFNDFPHIDAVTILCLIIFQTITATIYLDNHLNFFFQFCNYLFYKTSNSFTDLLLTFIFTMATLLSTRVSYRVKAHVLFFIVLNYKTTFLSVG